MSEVTAAMTCSDVLMPRLQIQFNKGLQGVRHAASLCPPPSQTGRWSCGGAAAAARRPASSAP